MDDSTDLVKTVCFAVRGLRPGEYEVEYDGVKGRRFVSDNLKLDLPFAKTKAIHISFFSAR